MLGRTRVVGKTKDYGFLSVKKVTTQFLSEEIKTEEIPRSFHI